MLLQEEHTDLQDLERSDGWTSARLSPAIKRAYDRRSVGTLIGEYMVGK